MPIQHLLLKICYIPHLKTSRGMTLYPSVTHQKMYGVDRVGIACVGVCGGG